MPKPLYEPPRATETLTYREALEKYRRLYQLAKPNIKQGDELKLKKAVRLALAADQKKQYWKEGANVLQALDIAWIIADDIGLGIVPIICALLYDLAEETTPIEVDKIFGVQVTQTIYRLRKLGSIAQLKEIRNTESSEALIVALTQDPNIVLLKMAENLQKMRTLARLPYEQQEGIASHAKYIYVPIAHRLGLRDIKAELEDLCFKFANPIEYHALARQLKNTQDVRERLIKRFVKPIQKTLRKKKIPFFIAKRIKSMTSIWNKMLVRGFPLGQVYDIFAIRIILDVPASQAKLYCWKTHEAVTSLYKPHPSKFRNWLSYPRRNNYQALHVTVLNNDGVWVEVQIRTKCMDEMAEKGSAAHWRYKEANDVDRIPGLDTWLNQIRSALEQEAQDSNGLINTGSQLKINSIKVFTKKGQPVSLPIGATVLDYAFELGTTLGLQCIGGQINNKPVPYHHTLNHGDQVTVVTTSKPQVLKKWFDHTVTNKAFSAITKFLQQEKERKIARGKQLVQEWCCQLQLAWHQEVMEQLLVCLGEEKVEDLYYKLGEGNITLQQIKNLPKMPYKIKEHPLPCQKLKPFVQAPKGETQQLLVISSSEAGDSKQNIFRRKA